MKKFSLIIALAVCAVIFAVACGIILWIDYGLWSLACYAAMIIAFPVSIILHELGHVLFGAMAKIKAVPHFCWLGSSSCDIVPKTDKRLRVRLYFTALGGIFVNLLFMVLGLVAFFVEAVPSWLCIFLPSSLYLFELNVLPQILPNGKTDGMIMNELQHNTDTAKVMIAVLTVQAQVLNGKPIQEVDEKLLFDLPQIQEDDLSFISLTELRYEYFKAKGDEEQAKKYKTRLEDLKQYSDI